MLNFSTKAETLKQVEGKVVKSKVLSQYCFTVRMLETQPDFIIDSINSQFANHLLIVRSSALTEDSINSSQAGKFMSVFNVSTENVIEAATEVAETFVDGCLENQIFVQPMLTNIIMSGVIFTIDPNTGGNYYVINYDNTGSTDLITSGKGVDTNISYIFHHKKSGEKRLDRLVEAAEEMVELFNHKSIDIEFAFNQDEELFLLQARPLVLKIPIADYEEQRKALERVESFIQRDMKIKPYVSGKRTIYGVMPDWNPAEIIGIRPKMLAQTLYRRLVTNGVWAYQRNNYGYKNLRSFPLMVDLCGLPYIDTRTSFNSFIPKDTDELLSGKLVDYYLDRLAATPDKHDKIEFDIVLSCYTFDLPDKIQALGAHGFTKLEQKALQHSLHKMTNNIINMKNGLWIEDSQKINTLKARHKIVMDSDLDLISKIYWLLEDCARYGTLPFAGLARAGFIAVSLLNSLVSIGVLSDQDCRNYIASLETVSSNLGSDWNNLSFSEFIKEYGHLRPGTYDITSERYDMIPDFYFGSHRQSARVKEKQSFTLEIDQYSAIQKEMNKHGIEGDVLSFFGFIKASIEGREYAKFIFSRSLSDCLELIAKLGSEYGFSREEIAHMDCNIIDQLYSSADDIHAVIAKSIAIGKEKYAEKLSLTMPPVILSYEDIYSFSLPSGTPNFVTLNEVSGDVCSDDFRREAISNKILLIPAADPGYDWIFSCNILGFITAYGGVNSHMAIRSGELGIPAVIGVGEKMFLKYQQSKTLHINCANKKIEILQ
ncbi:PEP/pyruvate-binding domain-containing protein [Paenibacillus sp. IHBB 10380]|uniref:PEP/pyruvate-binding domain-containing protein n=1 Tax=Paenibacillus sp. IHBB 10380 TaxID=1566358 RepID=UPI0005CF9E83|nr:PEP/pyruvate-binding domain-containing protein [Paenibacillus sp. IHBB 10380]AJS57199.1 phosphoenolpyruvate synthase [Paenibacillus sp. IHBB 10380]